MITDIAKALSEMQDLISKCLEISAFLKIELSRSIDDGPEFETHSIDPVSHQILKELNSQVRKVNSIYYALQEHEVNIDDLPLVKLPEYLNPSQLLAALDGFQASTANARYKTIVFKEHIENSDSDDENALNSVNMPEVPNQSRGISLEVKAGRLSINRAPDAKGNEYAQIEALQPAILESLKSAYATCVSGNQPFGLLADRLMAYQTEVDKPAAEINFGLLFARAAALQNALNTAKDRSANPEDADLDEAVENAIETILDIHKPIMMASGIGAALQSAALGWDTTPEQFEQDKYDITAVRDSLVANPELINEEDREDLIQALTVPKGSTDVKHTVNAARTAGNIAKVVIDRPLDFFLGAGMFTFGEGLIKLGGGYFIKNALDKTKETKAGESLRKDFEAANALLAKWFENQLDRFKRLTTRVDGSHWLEKIIKSKNKSATKKKLEAQDIKTLLDPLNALIEKEKIEKNNKFLSPEKAEYYDHKIQQYAIVPAIIYSKLKSTIHNGIYAPIDTNDTHWINTPHFDLHFFESPSGKDYYSIYPDGNLNVFPMTEELSKTATLMAEKRPKGLYQVKPNVVQYAIQRLALELSLKMSFECDFLFRNLDDIMEFLEGLPAIRDLWTQP